MEIKKCPRCKKKPELYDRSLQRRFTLLEHYCDGDIYIKIDLYMVDPIPVIKAWNKYCDEISKTKNV